MKKHRKGEGKGNKRECKQKWEMKKIERESKVELKWDREIENNKKRQKKNKTKDSH